MAVTYGFYNSISGDRVYDAMQMSRLFDGIINDGVFMSVGDAMIVVAAGGMNITVGTGRAWFNHTWTINDADLSLVIDSAEPLLNRIDSVVLEVNASEETRANSIKIIKGTPASTPVAPTLTATELVNQHPLCNIYVGAGVTGITTSNITLLIGTDACPFITGILETINSDALIAQWSSQFNDYVAHWVSTFDGDIASWGNAFTADLNQWTADFNNWFNTIKGILGTDPAGELAERIDALEGTGWTNETVKGNADAIAAIKGEGWTDESLVGNAGALAEHIADDQTAHKFRNVDSGVDYRIGIDDMGMYIVEV